MPRTRSKLAAETAAPAAQATEVDPPDPADPADPVGRAPDLAREAVIRLHAYRLWERRGRSDGHAMQDWLQAEAELAHLGDQGRARLQGPGAEGAR